MSNHIGFTLNKRQSREFTVWLDNNNIEWNYWGYDEKSKFVDIIAFNDIKKAQSLYREYMGFVKKWDDFRR